MSPVGFLPSSEADIHTLGVLLSGAFGAGAFGAKPAGAFGATAGSFGTFSLSAVCRTFPSCTCLCFYFLAQVLNRV